ncbi:hypothetical protein B0H19DRAFT_64436 [Mycena capillaripes]|nr:hypothetical protein B0H19DRAFT_64436 [Mycena capillaripes]
MCVQARVLHFLLLFIPRVGIWWHKLLADTYFPRNLEDGYHEVSSTHYDPARLPANFQTDLTICEEPAAGRLLGRRQILRLPHRRWIRAALASPFRLGLSSAGIHLPALFSAPALLVGLLVVAIGRDPTWPCSYSRPSLLDVAAPLTVGKFSASMWVRLIIRDATFRTPP